MCLHRSSPPDLSWRTKARAIPRVIHSGAASAALRAPKERPRDVAAAQSLARAATRLKMAARRDAFR